ncbi:MAG: tetratricopeptide repeat protein [Elusimicrobia bacterium]|nr:tetratricopeptide repeat protein [Elusimicrobiota bacterium]
MKRLLGALILAPALVGAEETVWDRAKKAFQERNYVQARDLLRELTDSKPADAQVYMLTGHTHIKLENWSDAALAFETAADIDPGLLAARIQLGFLYEKLKEPVKARKTWQHVLELAKDEKTKTLAKKHLENLR